MSNSERAIYLLDRYIDDTATISEREELAHLLEDASIDDAARLHLGQLLRSTEPLAAHSPARWEALYAAIGREAATEGETTAEEKAVVAMPPGRPLYRLWWAVAAVLLGLVGSIYFFQQRSGSAVVGPVRVSGVRPVPGGNFARLTLSDGSVISLDSAQNGTLAQQGNASVAKLANGQLAYKILDEKPTAVLFNTLTTPKGGQYRLRLPDGSEVWLNAASSITYPTAFTGDRRQVVIRGEAYFEVAKNASMPFRVSVAPPPGRGGDSLQVEVLGTHFNVNAYEDELDIRTTLLEGSVRLVNGSGRTMLTPGQQGNLQGNGRVSVIPDADMDEAIAWKEGRFNFDNADIRTVMRQIARWYDVEVVFEGEITKEKFAGEIPRSSKLTEVFTILELSNVHFKVDGRKVIVMH